MTDPGWAQAKEFEVEMPDQEMAGPQLRWKIGGTIKGKYRPVAGGSEATLSLDGSGRKLGGEVKGDLGNGWSAKGTGKLDGIEGKAELGGQIAKKVQDELTVKLGTKIDPEKLKQARSPKDFGKILGEQIGVAVEDKWDGLAKVMGGKASLAYEAGVQASTHPLVVKVKLEFVPFSWNAGGTPVELSVEIELKLCVGPSLLLIQAGGILGAAIVVDATFLLGVAHIFNRAHDLADAKGCLHWYTEGFVRKVFELPNAKLPLDARKAVKAQLYKHGQREAFAYARMTCLSEHLSNKHPVQAYRDWLVAEHGGRKDHAVQALRVTMNNQLDEIGARLGVRV